MVGIAGFTVLACFSIFVSISDCQHHLLEYSFAGADYWIVETDGTSADHSDKCNQTRQGRAWGLVRCSFGNWGRYRAVCKVG